MKPFNDKQKSYVSACIEDYIQMQKRAFLNFIVLKGSAVMCDDPEFLARVNDIEKALIESGRLTMILYKLIDGEDSPEDAEFKKFLEEHEGEEWKKE